LTLARGASKLRLSTLKEEAMKFAFVVAAALLAPPFVQAADTPGSGGMGPPPPTVQERLAKARQAVERSNWSAAMRELNVALREEPQNADVHNLLGYTYRKRSGPDMVKAFEHYNMALKFNPQHKGAHEYIGEAYLIDKRPAEAERHLAELEKICGNRDCEEYRDLAKAIADFKAKN
jgi:tetratricopeptide (TPR) repeat protein